MGQWTLRVQPINPLWLDKRIAFFLSLPLNLSGLQLQESRFSGLQCDLLESLSQAEAVPSIHGGCQGWNIVMPCFQFLRHFKLLSLWL